MKRFLTLIAIVAAVLSACGDEDEDATTTTPPAPTQEEATGSGAEDPASAESEDEDVAGNCDEAEHADDPECAGTGGVGVDDEASEDSGDDSGGIGDDSGGEDDDSGTGGVGAYGG